MFKLKLFFMIMSIIVLAVKITLKRSCGGEGCLVDVVNSIFWTIIAVVTAWNVIDIYKAIKRS